MQRRKVDAKENEAFAAQHAMIDLQQEIDRLSHQVKVIEGQRDALKMALAAEEVAKIAAEGAIGLPTTPEDDEFASPKKQSRKHKREESLKENVDPEAPTMDEELMAMKEALRVEKRMRTKADDQVHFMKMECQFQCCSCRVAERQGTDYVHDDMLAKRMGGTVGVIADEILPAEDSNTNQTVARSKSEATTRNRPSTPSQQLVGSQPREESNEPLINFSPSTGTFYKAASPTKPASSEQEQPDIQSTNHAV